MRDFITNYILNSTNETSDYSIKAFPPHALIALEGERCNAIGIVMDGHLEISSSTIEGNEFIIQELWNNDVFGDVLLFTSSPIYPGTIRCLSSCKIIFIDERQLLHLLQKDSLFLINYLKVISNKAFLLNERVKLLSQPSIREKIFFYLKRQSILQKSNHIKLSMNKEKLAQLFNVSRPSLSRELIALRDEKKIVFDRYSITIL